MESFNERESYSKLELLLPRILSELRAFLGDFQFLSVLNKLIIHKTLKFLRIKRILRYKTQIKLESSKVVYIRRVD